MHTLARHRHSDHDQSDHAQTLGQCRPVNHYPTSRTIEMHMLPQCWLDINIPTMSNPTMRGRWASVARPSITRRRPHSKCICWLDVEIPTTTNPTMHRHRANVAQPTITRLRAQSKCIMLTQCWLDVNIPTMYCNPTMCGRWASVAQPSITRCCAHSECTRWPMHAMLARHRHSDRDQSDHAPTLVQRHIVI